MCLLSRRLRSRRCLPRLNRNPHAAAVLVEVLRAGDGLGVASALAVESLGYATLQGGAEFRAWLADYRERRGAKPGKAERRSSRCSSRAMVGCCS